MAAQIKSSGKAPGITRRSLGSPGESSRSAHRVMVARMGRTAQPSRSDGPVGRGGRWLRSRRAGHRTRASRIRRRDTGDEGHAKPRRPRGYADLTLDLGGVAGRARLMETRLGLKPDWGKLNVRNFREGAGNVTRGAGLRPTAKAVDMPPDPTVGAPALYPAGPAVRQRLRQHGRQGRPDNGVHQSAGPEAEALRQGEG
jgi:hypothetical protein